MKDQNLQYAISTELVSLFKSFILFEVGINWRPLQIRFFTFKVRTRKINPSGPTGDKREEIKRIFSLLSYSYLSLSLPLPYLLPFVFIHFLPLHSFFQFGFLSCFLLLQCILFFFTLLSLLSWRRPTQISSICLPLRKSFHRYLTNMKAMFVEGSCRCDLLRGSKHCSYRKRVSVCVSECLKSVSRPPSRVFGNFHRCVKKASSLSLSPCCFPRLAVAKIRQNECGETTQRGQGKCARWVRRICHRHDVEQVRC